jgi:hypothetical protein
MFLSICSCNLQFKSLHQRKIYLDINLLRYSTITTKKNLLFQLYSNSKFNMTSDPFSACRHELQHKIASVNALFDVCKEQNNYSLTTNAIRELHKELKHVEWFLSDMEESVTIVAKDPNRFRLLSTELLDRKEYISNFKHSIQLIKNNVTIFEQQQAKNQKIVSQIQTKNGAKLDRSLRQDNQSYINSQFLLQQRIIQQQDGGLESIIQKTKNVQQIAISIGEELNTQLKGLEELDAHVQSSKTRMDRIMIRLNKFINNSGYRRKICFIILLVLVVIIGLIGLVMI